MFVWKHVSQHHPVSSTLDVDTNNDDFKLLSVQNTALLICHTLLYALFTLFMCSETQGLASAF